MKEFDPFDSFENFSGNHGQTMLPFSHRFEEIKSEAISMRKNKGVAQLSMDSGINTAVLETSSDFSKNSIFEFYWKFAAKNTKINGKVEQKSLRLPITIGAFFALISAFAWPAFSLLYGQMFTTLAQLNASNSSPSITIGIFYALIYYIGQSSCLSSDKNRLFLYKIWNKIFVLTREVPELSPSFPNETCPKRRACPKRKAQGQFEYFPC